MIGGVCILAGLCVWAATWAAVRALRRRDERDAAAVARGTLMGRVLSLELQLAAARGEAGMYREAFEDLQRAYVALRAAQAEAGAPTLT